MPNWSCMGGIQKLRSQTLIEKRRIFTTSKTNRQMLRQKDHQRI